MGVAKVRVCAPHGGAELLAEVAVPLVPVGQPVRLLLHGATPPSAAEVPRLLSALVAEQFDKLAAAAEGCDARVTSGLMPAAASARSVAERLGIRSVHVSYCPIVLPSPHDPPFPLQGRPIPPDVTDRRVLDDLDVQNYDALYGPALNTNRASIGLPPVDLGHVPGPRRSQARPVCPPGGRVVGVEDVVKCSPRSGRGPEGMRQDRIVGPASGDIDSVFAALADGAALPPAEDENLPRCTRSSSLTRRRWSSSPATTTSTGSSPGSEFLAARKPLTEPVADAERVIATSETNDAQPNADRPSLRR